MLGVVEPACSSPHGPMCALCVCVCVFPGGSVSLNANLFSDVTGLNLGYFCLLKSSGTADPELSFGDPLSRLPVMHVAFLGHLGLML